MTAIRCLNCQTLFVSYGAYLHPTHRCCLSTHTARVVETTEATPPASGHCAGGVVIPLFQWIKE